MAKLCNIKKFQKLEIYDNSNANGLNFVSGANVYYLGEPKKNEFRRYNLNKSINNDLSAYKELINRRFKKINKNNYPDLIIVDGGILQIKAIENALDKKNIKIPVAGLVKNSNHKTNDLIYKGKYLQIKKDKELYSYLFNIQENIHKYTINYFRQKSSKNIFVNSLTEIENIGEKTAIKLINEFKNIQNIKRASLKELVHVTNNKKYAEKILNFFQENK